MRLLRRLTLLALIVACSPAARAAERPNIVYILADDLGYGDLGCYGQQILQTPNVDRLADAGMRFDRHYAGCTVCAPSRAAFLEGKHTGHTSVRGNQPEHLMDTDSTTMAESLKSAGYATGVIGKWGVGHLPPPNDPKHHGFDYHFGYVNMWHAHNFYPEYLYRNSEKVYLPGNVLDERLTFNYQPEGTGVAREKVTFAPYEIEREALAYINRNQDHPFFLYLALNQPHNNGEMGRIYGDGGYEVPSYGAFTNRSWPNAEKGFAANIRIIDDIVGNVVDTVRAAGLEDRTLVIFSSDNGGHDASYGHNAAFFKSNGMLRGHKRDLYEGGIRVPFIVKWPGQVAAGTTSDHLSAMWDVLPTFCEIAGADIPAGIDGISILPAMLGRREQPQHHYLYWEFHSQGGKQAVLEGRWKAVKLNVTSPDPAVFELYDLETDPREATNVAAKHPKIVARLQGYMNEAHVPHPVLKLQP